MIDTVQAASFLKIFYSPTFIANSIAKKVSPLVALCADHPDRSGKSYNFLSVVDENPSGSATFSSAQGVANTMPLGFGGQYTVPYYEDHSVGRITTKAAKESRNDKGAFAQLLRYAMDSSLRMAAHRKSIAMYTLGWGELAQFSYTATDNFFTCLRRSDVYRFMRGQRLQVSSSLNAAVLRVEIAACYVDKVDERLGRVWVMGADGVSVDFDDLITAPATNDWVFTDGDRQNSATPTRLRPIGMPGWIPDTAPVGDDLGYGVDRSKSSRLYGNSVTTGGTLVERFMDAGQIASTFGNAEKMLGVTSPLQYLAMCKVLQSDRRFTDLTSKGGAGFKALTIMAYGTELSVLPDKYCSDDTSYVVNPDNIELNSNEAWPHIDDTDGRQLLRISDQSGLEVRIYSDANICFKDTAACVRITNPAL